MKEKLIIESKEIGFYRLNNNSEIGEQDDGGGAGTSADGGGAGTALAMTLLYSTAYGFYGAHTH